MATATLPEQRAAPPASPARVARPAKVMLLVALAASAAIADAKSMFDVASHYLLFAILYGLLAWAQVVWAGWVYHAPDDERALAPAAYVCGGLIALWFVSRFVGLPIGPYAGHPTPIGIPDFAATIDEAAFMTLVFALRHPRGRVAARLAWLQGGHANRIGVMLCSMSLLAGLLSPQLHVTASGLLSWCVP
ncbi:MAG TPA: hypothetical protein VGF63_09905 [Solirubrobacteraceae bacterium]|jgi:hypothetical protein